MVRMPVNQREIKIPYAFKDGAWIHISQVENGLKANCICPCCNKSLLAKKGTKVTHHFAHYKKADCQPETVLHFIAKNFLFQKIKKHLESDLPLNVSWLCKICERKHEANLLRRAKKAYLEYKLGDCKPDIALLTENDVPVAVVEIVVTHKPEDSAVTYYQQNKIAVVECDIGQGSDLELIQSNEILNASRVDQCTNPRCKQCGNPFGDKIILFIVPQPCRRCERTMKVCFIRSRYDFRGPKDFDEREVLIAQQNGAQLEKQFSQTINQAYFANTCSQCRRWIGEHYLLDCLPDKNDKNSEWEEFLIGYHCYHCERDWPCRVEKIRHIRQHELPQDDSQLKFFS